MKTLKIKCDQCSAAAIMGVACHETDCVKQHHNWVRDGDYLVPGDPPAPKCHECGCECTQDGRGDWYCSVDDFGNLTGCGE